MIILLLFFLFFAMFKANTKNVVIDYIPSGYFFIITPLIQQN